MAHQEGFAKHFGVCNTQNSHCGPTPLKEHSVGFSCTTASDLSRRTVLNWMPPGCPARGPERATSRCLPADEHDAWPFGPCRRQQGCDAPVTATECRCFLGGGGRQASGASAGVFLEPVSHALVTPPLRSPNRITRHPSLPHPVPLPAASCVGGLKPLPGRGPGCRRPQEGSGDRWRRRSAQHVWSPPSGWLCCVLLGRLLRSFLLADLSSLPTPCFAFPLSTLSSRRPTCGCSFGRR